MIRAMPLTAEAFAPFGAVADAGDQVRLGPLVNDRMDVSPRLMWSVSNVASLPYSATIMERHLFSSQCFIPGDPAARWLVLVMPRTTDGAPDPTGALAFVANGGQALTYAPNVWHHPLTSIGPASRFAVLTHLNDTPADTEFADLATPLEVG